MDLTIAPTPKGPTMTNLGGGRNGTHAIASPHNPCPECGGGRGNNGRCYACKPWNNRSRPAAAGTGRERPEKNVCPKCRGWKSRHHRWCRGCDKVAAATVRGLPAVAPVGETFCQVPAATASTPPVDAEVGALASVVTALDRLDDAARARVMAFAASRFGSRSTHEVAT